MNKPTLGTAAAQPSTAFATAAQGGKADTAVQSVKPGANITVDNTDPLNPIVSASVTGGGGGTVTSVGLVAPAWLAVTQSPVTTSGTLTLAPATG